MVGEFPELQGIMGRYYALHDGLRHGVADCRSKITTSRASPAMPCRATDVGTVVALADKLETLSGLFGIGQSTHRRQGPVCTAPPCAGRDPHAQSNAI